VERAVPKPVSPERTMEVVANPEHERELQLDLRPPVSKIY
jgi:hypothetical protein